VKSLDGRLTSSLVIPQGLLIAFTGMSNTDFRKPVSFSHQQIDGDHAIIILRFKYNFESTFC
jgi:hypothetical protein